MVLSTAIVSITSSWPSPPLITLTTVSPASPEGLLAQPLPSECASPTSSPTSAQTEATPSACRSSLGLALGASRAEAEVLSAGLPKGPRELPPQA